MILCNCPSHIAAEVRKNQGKITAEEFRERFKGYINTIPNSCINNFKNVDLPECTQNCMTKNLRLAILDNL